MNQHRILHVKLTSTLPPVSSRASLRSSGPSQVNPATRTAKPPKAACTTAPSRGGIRTTQNCFYHSLTRTLVLRFERRHQCQLTSGGLLSLAAFRSFAAKKKKKYTLQVPVLLVILLLPKYCHSSFNSST